MLIEIFYYKKLRYKKFVNLKIQCKYFGGSFFGEKIYLVLGKPTLIIIGAYYFDKYTLNSLESITT